MPKCRDYGGLCDAPARDFAVTLAPCDTCAALLKAGPNTEPLSFERAIKPRSWPLIEPETTALTWAFHTPCSRRVGWSMGEADAKATKATKATPPQTPAEARLWMMAHPMQVLVQHCPFRGDDRCRFNPSVGFESRPKDPLSDWCAYQPSDYYDLDVSYSVEDVKITAAEPTTPKTAAEARLWMMAHPMQVLVESRSDTPFIYLVRFNAAVGFEAKFGDLLSDWYAYQPSDGNDPGVSYSVA